MGETGAGVGGFTEEDFVVRPVGGLGAAGAPGCGVALGDGPRCGVHDETGGAVRVAGKEGELASGDAVGSCAYRDGLARCAVVAGAGQGFRGALGGEVDFGGAQVEDGVAVSGCPADEEFSAGVVEVAGVEFGFGARGGLTGGDELAFGVPLQRLLGLGTGAAGGVAGLVVVVRAGFGSGGAGQRVRLAPSGAVGVVGCYVTGGGVGGFCLALARVVVGVAGPVRGGTIKVLGGAPARGAVSGLRGPGFGQALVAVVGEALVVGLGRAALSGLVEDRCDVARVVLREVQVLRRVAVQVVGDGGLLQTTGAVLVVIGEVRLLGRAGGIGAQTELVQVAQREYAAPWR